MYKRGMMKAEVVLVEMDDYGRDEGAKDEWRLNGKYQPMIRQ